MRLKIILVSILTALGSILGVTAATASTNHASHIVVKLSNPLYQTGYVHSQPDGMGSGGGNADVVTINGGQTWCFNDNCNGSGPSQVGCVHSNTTGGNAGVTSINGGYEWTFWAYAPADDVAYCIHTWG
jgi:hypothetical protein